ncbi:MAG: protein arginine kinase [[Clostridium] cellulosi]
MKWYLETGPEGSVVISTRIRLARNIADIPFPCRMTKEQSAEVIERARAALFGSDLSGKFDFIDMQKLTPARAMSLSEKHLISPEFAANREGRGLFLSKDESVSIMINEEDHIRIQVMLPGMQLEQALKQADYIDDQFDEKLKYAFDENLGYLTQCPTNLGTGLRASLMLHLPALEESGALNNFIAAVSKLGLVMRGTYGEGSRVNGSFYQLSNQVTLGISEKQAIDDLTAVAKQLINQELEAREAYRKTGAVFEDKVWRSFGVLKNAHILSTEECMSLISNVRLGATMKIIDIPLEILNEIISEVQPSTLIASAGRNLDTKQRDELRAKIVREKLAGL